ncbi:hypothetical protein AAFC00_005743 [Neodothiora populina]|uniref:DUF171-domain-containing protein n=1 Tax=Neodothiora populina TaxID=2781224 RepID=A0ABR3P5Q1_9PEZI
MSFHDSKKRKRNVVVHQGSDEVDTSKPSAVFTPTGGRQHTLSIALPGSVIANAQTHETKTLLAAQVARACAVFSVDEIVVFNDGQSQAQPKKRSAYDYRDDETGYTGYSDPDDFLYHVLSYLETPPHLRKSLFPMHPNLRTAGMMPSLDMPHHLRANEWCRYREGISVSVEGTEAQQAKRKKPSSATPDTYTLVDCGLPVRARIPVSVPTDSRITVRFASDLEPRMDGYTPLDAAAVTPDTPREEAGYFWGYSTRLASSLSAIFTECPYDGGYDVSVGTSERGIPVSSLLSASQNSEGGDIPPIPAKWNHLIIVFGGVAGLEVALKADKELTSKGVSEARDVFDYWVNLVPNQGSRTIRTEEAVWLGLMGLRGVVQERLDAV